MNWFDKHDKTKPVISAKGHIESAHGDDRCRSVPETCVLFEIGMAIKHLESTYSTETIVERIPAFLENPKCIALEGEKDIGYIRGAFGAPAAVDLLETLAALGAKRIIVSGMCGGFSPKVSIGDILVPPRILCEEGTSQHYYRNMKWVNPDEQLLEKTNEFFKGKKYYNYDTVTTDAVYRQTLKKESYWRKKKCVGVDMESSAILSVSNYLSLQAISILFVSDNHPLGIDDKRNWEWGNASFDDMRKDFITQIVGLSRYIHSHA